MKILVEENNGTKPGTLGGPRDSGANQGIKDIADKTLRSSLSTLSRELSDILVDINQVGNYRLKEVQLQAEITAEGGFVLIGKAGIKGAVTLTFANE